LTIDGKTNKQPVNEP